MQRNISEKPHALAPDTIIDRDYCAGNRDRAMQQTPNPTIENIAKQDRESCILFFRESGIRLFL